MIRVKTQGFGPGGELNQLTVRPREFGTPEALVRGVAAAFKELGLEIGGFEGDIRSTLPVGAGLSSSAAFSVLIGRILSELYNDGKVDPVVIARAAQQAENRFFGKPCGLMSQLVCALGHTVYVDFKTMEIQPVPADFAAMGLTLCLTETGGSHAGLDTSYARIPADMVYIANLFDKGVLADVDPAAFRAKGWDPANRPVRRAMHFFDENERVPQMRDALQEGRRGDLYAPDERVRPLLGEAAEQHRHQRHRGHQAGPGPGAEPGAAGRAGRLAGPRRRLCRLRPGADAHGLLSRPTSRKWKRPSARVPAGRSASSALRRAAAPSAERRDRQYNH